MKLYYIIILVIIVILYIIYTMQYSDIVHMESDIDKNVYIIRRGRNHTEKFYKDSANTLAIINQRMIRLIDYLYMTYMEDESKNYFIKKLKENYNPYIISEAAVDPLYTTYTIDKKDMHICLRTRDSKDEIYDINLLMYVVLHEAAHLCNYNKNGYPIIGHGQEFRNIFKFLVEQAILIDVYQYVDYTHSPKEYCGINIQSQVISD